MFVFRFAVKFIYDYFFRSEVPETLSSATDPTLDTYKLDVFLPLELIRLVFRRSALMF